jgi:NAD(P)-dependent dehydrogenase (short-subunit alcohol dehydrogenase family)
MKNKNIIITGGNAGIGLATAIALAKTGANIYIVSRSKEKAEEAVKEIISAGGNNNVKYFVANLSSQKSIHQLAAEIKNELLVVDVLINNAGGTFTDFMLSEDELEMTIATNHFAYFLLTNLLLDLIKKSAQGRIVNVASGSHYKGKIDFETFTRKKSYFVMRAYEQSKLANVLFTNELAERLKGTNVTANSLHPGFVKTQIGNKNASWYSSLFWTIATKLGAISVEDGAKTSVYLASSTEVKNITGKYFDKCTEKKPSALALNKELGKKLWKKSEELCPLN